MVLSHRNVDTGFATDKISSDICGAPLFCNQLCNQLWRRSCVSVCLGGWSGKRHKKFVSWLGGVCSYTTSPCLDPAVVYWLQVCERSPHKPLCSFHHKFLRVLGGEKHPEIQLGMSSKFRIWPVRNLDVDVLLQYPSWPHASAARTAAHFFSGRGNTGRSCWFVGRFVARGLFFSGERHLGDLWILSRIWDLIASSVILLQLMLGDRTKNVTW